ncbi:outer membrane beta-barrel protein [Chryseobacterium camelliae]|uniref:Outer membrane beta-barrel protein n=1 Tax=Chryseobacterium camelliae TaxID=1265445 RepID=A0ABY7QI96_9FLAO|nr:outer membrane beta-barrel protein [Chryseobacterium camelliae]WBV59372.1 outer membrane beta-barrel protein [Chryseobacterium camelliae]
MNNNEWLNDLRRKMEDHTEDVPDGLWDDIKNELFVEDKPENSIPVVMNDDLKAQNKAVSKLNHKPLLYRICGVAAVITLFFIVGRLLVFNGKKEFVNRTQTKENSSEKISYANESDENEKSLKIETVLQNMNLGNNFTEKTLNKTKSGEVVFLKNTDFKDQKYNQESVESHYEQNIAQQQNKNTENPQVNEETETYELLTKEERERKKKLEETEKIKLAKNQDKKSWMVGVLAGNTSSSSTQQFPGYATLNGTTISLPEMWSSEYEENPLMAILLANQNQKVDAKLKHKTPVTFGASVAKRIGKKWSVGTGVNYTRLSSDLTSGSESNFISSEQNVHYVGIPVQVNYNIIKKGAFTGYITGGGLIEKAVSGDIKTKYIVDGTVKEESKEGISEKPVQMSVNTAAGLQLKVVKNIGIYAEPGVSYHFKDNSSLQTIYKEKPLNFNLKFGVRLIID